MSTYPPPHDEIDDGPDEIDADLFDEETVDTTRCPHCGEEIYAEADRCPRCGTWLSEAERLSSRPTSWAWWLLAAVGVAAFLLVYALL